MKYLILGAGPTGLALGNRLKDNGEDSFLILEREEIPGGLCRSIDLDGAPFDIGGPHFLDTRSKEITEYLYRFMPKSEWNMFDRDSKIQLGNQMINSPIEANIWQMSIEKQVEYLESIAASGCNTGIEMPQSFLNWISWKLGKKIADDYMIPYNAKLFGEDLDALGIYWLYKLPSVSFRETLLSCLKHEAYGQQPCQTRFHYPKNFGFGELWKRMGQRIETHIEYGKGVNSIDFNKLEIKTEDGASYNAEYIITTIPWREMKHISGMPDNIKEDISKLKYGAIETRYFDEELKTSAQWIYCPEEELPYHRLTIRPNIYPGSHGMIVETRKERVSMFGKEDLAKYNYMNEYAYPLNTIEKPEIMDRVITFAENKNVYCIGRWGEHKHHNSDVVVELAMKFADKLTKH